MDGGQITRRVELADYIALAQIYLQDNFLLERPLAPSDIKPRLLGHWGTCHGISSAYANLVAAWGQPDMAVENPAGWVFVCGPGHGFPALQANLWLDGVVQPIGDVTDQGGADLPQKTLASLSYICRNFSWPRGYPSHASPFTPGVIVEGGELGYSLGAAYGAVLDVPERKVACLIGDGEMETAALLASLNCRSLLGERDGWVLPILHRNGYKISGPTIPGRLSQRELQQQLAGFGFQPLFLSGDDPAAFQTTLQNANRATFIVMDTPKGEGAPDTSGGEKVAGNYLSHQVPLADCKRDPTQLAQLETWLRSYQVNSEELLK